MTGAPTETETDQPVVSRNCVAGNHSRCLGTVHLPGSGLVVCECSADPDGDCGHGTDTYKARRNENR